jgi:hypothetical protein
VVRELRPGEGEVLQEEKGLDFLEPGQGFEDWDLGEGLDEGGHFETADFLVY